MSCRFHQHVIYNKILLLPFCVLSQQILVIYKYKMKRFSFSLCTCWWLWVLGLVPMFQLWPRLESSLWCLFFTLNKSSRFESKKSMKDRVILMTRGPATSKLHHKDHPTELAAVPLVKEVSRAGKYILLTGSISQ